ncbi:MAG TPA: response regulator transcription factor [Acidimicrobiia bacterium]|nr:response regulator transcription factor [Acidimicrobiia bacterium]
MTLTNFASTDDAPIRVLIVDDHALFRKGLELVLAAEPDLEIVGEASEGLEAIERAADLQPDVVLMDVRMPGVGGIEATRRIRNAQPATRVVMLTVSEDEEDLFAAVRAGATGYLLKEVSIDEVANAVRAVARGQALVTPSMASKLLGEFNVLSRRIDAQHGAAPRLTDREVEVLRLVAKGMSNKEIASELVIAENTVKNHVRNILEKLQLKSRMEAAMYAVREKLVDAT